MRPISFRSVWIIRFLSLAAILAVVSMSARGGEAAAPGKTEPANSPERVEWFRDLGFGLFIRWSLDSQLGSGISQSMVGASDDFLRRYIEGLPQTFNPDNFRPDEWAALAKLAGVKYVVFTAKHPSGFCMFETATTDFNIMNTPLRRDIVEEVVMRFRAQGIAPGLSFAPDDFWWRHQQEKPLQRRGSKAMAQNNPGLMEHEKTQLTELLNNYGPIDILSLDGNSDGLREVAWEIDPYTLVTRGAVETPEPAVPGFAPEGVWESTLRMGTRGRDEPTRETYQSGGELIASLIETRARGGNLLLEVIPQPDGELPIEQEERLREIALWMLINQECIYAVRPWVITNEGQVWFTKAKDADTVYAIVEQEQPWVHGTVRDIVLHSIRATADTTVSILGQGDVVLQNRPDVDPKTTFEQQADGIHVHAMRNHRIYEDREWPHPVVIRLTHVQPTLIPPRVATTAAHWDGAAGGAVVEGEIRSLGDADELAVGFEYRDVTGLGVMDRADAGWKATEVQRLSAPGKFSQRLTDLDTAREYAVRVVVRHPLLTLHGRDLRLSAP